MDVLRRGVSEEGSVAHGGTPRGAASSLTRPLYPRQGGQGKQVARGGMGSAVSLSFAGAARPAAGPRQTDERMRHARGDTDRTDGAGQRAAQDARPVGPGGGL